MVRVKICGITNAADARAASDLGAYALGFNFYEKSKRVISPADAWSIRRRLPSSIEAIGVFVNWEPSAIIALVGALQLNAAQLHGDESATQVNSCAKSVTVIKAFGVDRKFSLKKFSAYRSASAFLLDGAGSQYGGTGKVADWNVARKATQSHRIFLAGGLTPENVAEAIRMVRPYAVDVASGVESRPGKKDRGKLREFFAEVERANNDLSGAA